MWKKMLLIDIPTLHHSFRPRTLFYTFFPAATKFIFWKGAHIRVNLVLERSKVNVTFTFHLFLSSIFLWIFIWTQWLLLGTFFLKRQWCQKVGVPVVIGGDNLPSLLGIGLTDLPNIEGASPPVPTSLKSIPHKSQFSEKNSENP